jgi:hypothetical protein
MVIASSSKSNHSKSAFAPVKTGPPAKKAAAVSMAKAKKTKQQSIKKYVRTGNFFFLLGGNTSNVKPEQMKTEILLRKTVCLSF